MNTTNTGRVCPRCQSHPVSILATSPVAGCWDILGCPVCLYNWRTSEPAANSQPAHYPQNFRLDVGDLAHFPEFPRVPPSKKPGQVRK